MGRDLWALCTAMKIQNFNGTSPCTSTMGGDASTCLSAMARLKVSSPVTRATVEAATSSETSFGGEKQLQVQLDAALRESMEIKSNSEKAVSHQNQLLPQHSRSQPCAQHGLCTWPCNRLTQAQHHTQAWVLQHLTAAKTASQCDTTQGFSDQGWGTAESSEHLCHSWLQCVGGYW